MFRSLPRLTRQERRKSRLPALALPWLLFLIATLAALSCTGAGADGPAIPATEALPAVSVAPSAGTDSPAASPTQAGAVSVLASPTPSLTTSAAASPTVGTVAAACPPAIVPGEVPVYRYRVLAAYPHNPGAFTQGLVYTNSTLYEGTGLYNGLSSLRKVDLETGAILQMITLATDRFGEGIAVHGQRILQLTWLNEVGFIYNRDTFDLIGTFSYLTEGWGLTHDGTRFIMSDGTATLHFWDLQTLAEIGQVQVHDGRGPVPCLNELEYIQGQVYANVWQTDYLAIIEPATGLVTAWVDLAGLLETQGPITTANVLNGIAYDVEGNRLFVTGKWWPWLFEIELVGPLRRTHLPQVNG
jgi:glutamine cyclotransferase